MTQYLAIIGLPLLFLADYAVVIVWLMKTAGRPEHGLPLGLRSLLIATIVVAIHLGMITAFLSGQSN